MNVYTWLDAVRAAVEECAGDVAFRRAVPRGGAERRDDLLELVRERLAPEAVARRQRERFVRSRRPIRDGQIRSLRALGSLTVATPVERRETVIADLAAGDASVLLTFEGKTLVFPSKARAEVEHAARATEPFRPADLPGELDEAGRVVLVLRLVREGFLRVSAAGEPGAPPPRGDAAASA